MGFTLQFVVGEKATLIEAVKTLDFDFLDLQEQEGKLVDFSLHIVPEDVDQLVRLISVRAAGRAFGLRENLDTTRFYFDSEESGAYLVEPRISQLFATLDVTGVAELVKEWFLKLSVLYNENLEPTIQAIQAIHKLIIIAKRAQREGLDLVHFWWL